MKKINIKDIKEDKENPRKITASAKKQLSKSISDFENISEITWNEQTKELVAGHQRFSQLKVRYKGLGLKETDKPDWFDFVDSSGNFIGFRLRVVNWDKEKQKAGNIVANSALSQGEFDKPKLDFILDKYDLVDFKPFDFKEIPLKIKGLDEGLPQKEQTKEPNERSDRKLEYVSIPFEAEEFFMIQELWDKLCHNMMTENPELETPSDVFRAILHGVLEDSGRA